MAGKLTSGGFAAAHALQLKAGITSSCASGKLVEVVRPDDLVKTHQSLIASTLQKGCAGTSNLAIETKGVTKSKNTASKAKAFERNQLLGSPTFFS